MITKRLHFDAEDSPVIEVPCSQDVCNVCNGTGTLKVRLRTRECGIPLSIAADGYNYEEPENPLPDTIYPVYAVELSNEEEWPWDGYYESDIEVLIYHITEAYKNNTLPDEIQDCLEEVPE